MAGYRRRGPQPRALRREKQAARHRAQFDVQLNAAATPERRMAAAYAYVLAGAASARRRGVSEAVLTKRLENLVARCATAGDDLFTRGREET